jgi:hypothetical protein
METLTLKPLSEAFLEEVARKHNVNAKVYRKQSSWLMKIVGFIIKPFNPQFMVTYTTTIGSTIYVPDDFMKYEDLHMLEIIAHETQHIIDHSKGKLLFTLGYLFPQCLALLSIFSIAAIWHLWMLWFLASLVFLSPIPSPFRYKSELAGYRTSVVFGRFVHKYPDSYMEHVYKWVVEQLSKKSYYFAWPFPDSIRKDLKDEGFMLEPRYQEIVLFLRAHKITS